MILYIVDNLFTNAVKYSKSETNIEIEISNSELIMKNEMQQKINCEPEELWEPTKVGNDARTGRSGCGMGLGIVKKIMDLYGYTGEINVYDEIYEVKIKFC